MRAVSAAISFFRKARLLALTVPLVCGSVRAAAPTPRDAKAAFEAEVKARESSFKTIQGRLRVENKNVKSGVAEILEGPFWVQRPDKMAVVYEPPAAQTVVSDGKTTWFYQPEVNQVTVSQAGAKPVFVEFQGGFRAMLAQKAIKKVEEAPEGYRVQVMRGGERLTLLVDGRTLLPLEIESSMDEHRTKVSFSELKLNDAIPAERFTFVIPEGAEVLDMSAGEASR
jgi:outer membrane lipoprotein carrier protein